MSAANCAKLKQNCDAVKSDHITNSHITQQPQNFNSNAIKNANNGTELNQKQEPDISSKQENRKQDSSNSSSSADEDFQQFQSQKISCDVQKVLKQEQELQKQLYSGSNVARGWLRVNHNNKVIYIR
jgi:hypothetical protein